MLSAVALLAALCCLSQQAVTRTVKQKRDLGDMESQYIYDGTDDSLSGAYGEDYEAGYIVMYFYVTYDKSFDDEWLETGSAAFLNEAERVKTTMKALISAALEVDELDVTVEVIGFLPGSTKAEIALKIPTYYLLTETAVANYVEDIQGTIDGAPILKVEELMTDPLGAAQQSEAIILELTYDYNISDGSIDLSDPESEAFKAEAGSLRDQLILHLVDKLAGQGTNVNPDQIELKVLSFVSDGSYTRAEISVLGEGIDVEQLSFVLQFLVIDNDIRINNRSIISLEELSREIMYYDDMGMEGKVMEELDDYLNGRESTPPDDEDLLADVEGEVMHDKDVNINGEIPTEEDILESAPPDENDPFLPGEIPPSRGDGAPRGDYGEPVPPDDDYEATPPDDEMLPCDEVRAPRYGTIDCMDGNKAGSFCHFTCAEETRMDGSDTIICAEGRWNEDPPVCRRIFCVPDYRSLENGMLKCNNDNLFESVCTFLCNPEYVLDGPQAIVCQRNQKWSAVPPECKPEPVICEEEYGEWSDCANGARSKKSVTILRGGVTTVCPKVDEVCIDCQLDWGVWSECDENMVRYRTQEVIEEKVGAGQECTEPQTESQRCRNCVIAWGNWSECVAESRTRSQYKEQTPIGGAECAPLDSQTQECNDCEMKWSDWGPCMYFSSIRQQEIVREAHNGGTPCGPLQEQQQECANCVAEWGNWTECVTGSTIRRQHVVQEAFGQGVACNLETEEELCENCRVAWSGWSACTNGVSERRQIVIQPAVGKGEACPEEEVESKDCANCELDWEDWSECSEGGERTRTQYVLQEPFGVEEPCPELETEGENCANCELDWEDWSECSEGERTRTQYVLRDPFGVEEPCPELQTEREICVDCAYTWGEWEECQFGLQRRYLTIDMDPVGAGAACPEEQAETKPCCLLVWSEWSGCTDGVRTRSQDIIIESDDIECSEPQVQSEKCVDCVLEWGEWSECENNRISRTQYMVEFAEGGGKDCPVVQTQDDYCANCVVEWGAWTGCNGGVREREQYIVEDPVGAVEECPELNIETEDCVDCKWEWSNWSDCESGKRIRYVNISQETIGVGEPCPLRKQENEICVDCVVEWSDWSPCEDGLAERNQTVAVSPAGSGKECPDLDYEIADCTDCVVDWQEWSECSGIQRTRTQYVVTSPAGRGRECPNLETVQEACADCVVEWTEWSNCFGDVQRREQIIVVDPVGAGKECPELEVETIECVSNDTKIEETICRFVDTVVGWNRAPTMRDLLLIGDESGSIGWVNFAKIKENFKSIARNIRGGIGTQETQLAMSSFARRSRIIFDFDDHYDIDDTVNAIDQVYFKGGYRSRIGASLRDANTWIFQQSSGMRSFPNLDDNIDHEILIATDGCRTSDPYHLQQGLKALKRRGIKLFVLAIASSDQRCRDTINTMVDDSDDLFYLDSWKDLDEMTRVITEKVCVQSTVGEEMESSADGRN